MYSSTFQVVQTTHSALKIWNNDNKVLFWLNKSLLKQLIQAVTCLYYYTGNIKIFMKTTMITKAVWYWSCRDTCRIIPRRPHMPKWAQICEKILSQEELEPMYLKNLRQKFYRLRHCGFWWPQLCGWFVVCVRNATMWFTANKNVALSAGTIAT